jgi:hypothetical protein
MTLPDRSSNDRDDDQKHRIKPATFASQRMIAAA